MLFGGTLFAACTPTHAPYALPRAHTHRRDGSPRRRPLKLDDLFHRHHSDGRDGTWCDIMQKRASNVLRSVTAQYSLARVTGHLTAARETHRRNEPHLPPSATPLSQNSRPCCTSSTLATAKRRTVIVGLEGVNALGVPPPDVAACDDA
jgi:hypothetical protein